MTVKYSGEGIRDNTDETKVMSFDVSGVTTNTTRTLTMPDRNVTIGDAGDLTGNLPAIDGSSLTNLPAGGKVLQVVNTVSSTDFSTVSTSLQDTGYSVTITPSSATSKILLMADYNANVNTTNADGMRVVFYRGGSQIGDENIAYRDNPTTSNFHFPTSIIYLDSPNTTSATTYKLYMRTHAGSGLLRIAADWGNVKLFALEIGA